MTNSCQVGRLRVMSIMTRMNVGGPAAQTSVVATGLDPRRFEPLLLVGAVGPDEADFVDLRAAGLPFQRIEPLGRVPRPLDDIRSLRAIAAEVRRFRPHIVHT